MGLIGRITGRSKGTAGIGATPENESDDHHTWEPITAAPATAGAGAPGMWHVLEECTEDGCGAVRTVRYETDVVHANDAYGNDESE